jgi:hypothetical protein
MDSSTLLEVGKWVVIVFVAGFIGYFGKHLSKLILQRLHKNGPDRQPQPMGAHEAEAKRHKYEYKLEKKKLKAEEKMRKEEAKRQEKLREEQEDD